VLPLTDLYTYLTPTNPDPKGSTDMSDPTPTDIVVLTEWWRDHDNVVLTAYYMRDHGATVGDMALLVEKPWKFEDEFTAAHAEWLAEQAS
jgi:hypothetical protein